MRSECSLIPAMLVHRSGTRTERAEPTLTFVVIPVKALISAISFLFLRGILPGSERFMRGASEEGTD